MFSSSKFEEYTDSNSDCANQASHIAHLTILHIDLGMDFLYSFRRERPFDLQSSSNSNQEIIEVSPTDLSQSAEIPDSMSMGTILTRPQPQQSSDVRNHDVAAIPHAQSFITHQRRPAIIPSDAELSPAEELAVRMRTGISNLKLKADGSRKDSVGGNSQDVEMVDNQTVSKRKASALDQDDQEWVDVDMEMDVANFSIER